MNKKATRRRELFSILFFLIFTLHGYSLDVGGKTTDFFVSPTGNDNWSGRLPDSNTTQTDGPLKTLVAVRDKIRQLQAAAPNTGEIHVYLRGGKYYPDGPLELTKEDGGSQKAPVIYAAYPGETVRLIAGKEVKVFTPVTNPEILKRFKKECRGFILQSDLKAQGITEFGTLSPRGFGRPMSPAGLELFFQNKPMTPARWPNTGWVRSKPFPTALTAGGLPTPKSSPEAGRKMMISGFMDSGLKTGLTPMNILNRLTRRPGP